jgi:hypothetical protein
MTYKATGIDPEIELRKGLENIKREQAELRARFYALPGEIHRAFAAPKGSAEYMSAGRLVAEQKRINKRFALINAQQDRIERVLNIRMVGRT